ncbi:TetR/AcrR family transcriptional regulator [Sphingomonas sp. HF-S4]|uniref:TetR/AcrR family transcriptional regulator n=1 Tax=Sphingomonas agrestis TaxID=3080540 RepID=A0ABU3Y208_9SPHN|nr:TetR/AcrR family transcriptional regulator [Sphingomonas sp. HF-S4]MDV3455415.1 TetR/AcrR family transcriptional regulator [Sphingomonas sp. HF-S4]
MATISALQTAAIQVLTREGLGHCTTTRIARRAGVSVGTIYQYYPNRDVLLAAVLERHLDGFSASVIGACQEVAGKPIAEMTRHLVAVLLRLKMHDPQEAAVLYAVAAEKTGKNIALTVHNLMLPAIAEMLRSAPDAEFPRLRVTAEVFLSIFLGLPRTMLEGYASAEFTESLATQLETALLAYLQAVGTGTGPAHND